MFRMLSHLHTLEVLANQINTPDYRIKFLCEKDDIFGVLCFDMAERIQIVEEGFYQLKSMTNVTVYSL